MASPHFVMLLVFQCICYHRLTYISTTSDRQFANMHARILTISRYVLVTTAYTMGITPCIRNKLLKRLVPSAFRAGCPNVKRHILIDDILTRFVNLRGQNDYIFTGKDLYEAFLRPIRLQQHAGCAVYIAIADDQSNTPAQKKATQAKRSANSDIEPYQGDWKIVDDGMVSLDTTMPTVDKIDMRRLMRTRSLRRQLWHYISGQLNHEEFDDMALIFEYNQKPEIFGVLDTIMVESHGHGEADLSLIYWASRFHEEPVIQRCASNGLLGWSMLNTMRLQPAKLLQWRTMRNSQLLRQSKLGQHCTQM